MSRVPAAVLAAVLLAGCAPPDTAPPVASPSASTTSVGPTLRRVRPTSTVTAYTSYAVDAKGARVAVYDKPGGRVVRRLANPQPSGAPLVFLLDVQRTDWLRVYLPVRPNGSRGWVRRRDVTVRGVTYRVDVLRGAHKLRLYLRDELVKEYPVAIGTEDTPTPGGTFYLKELLRPPDPNGPYGIYAYGLSGFSNVLTSFNGGEGVIGIHGTNDPSSVGRDVSHGCIRMRNEDINYLASRLPLGTPVRILP